VVSLSRSAECLITAAVAADRRSGTRSSRARRAFGHHTRRIDSRRTRRNTLLPSLVVSRANSSERSSLTNFFGALTAVRFVGKASRLRLRERVLPRALRRLMENCSGLFAHFVSSSTRTPNQVLPCAAGTIVAVRPKPTFDGGGLRIETTLAVAPGAHADHHRGASGGTKHSVVGSRTHVSVRNGFPGGELALAFEKFPVHRDLLLAMAGELAIAC